jgi:hypothetical protein
MRRASLPVGRRLGGKRFTANRLWATSDALVTQAPCWAVRMRGHRLYPPATKVDTYGCVRLNGRVETRRHIIMPQSILRL